MSEEAEQLYERARALELGARTAFVEESCRGDPQLCEELVSLLEEAAAAEEFFVTLGDSVFAAPFLVQDKEGGDGTGDQARIDTATPLPHIELSIGTMIGRYRILSLIGSGGMGVVYRASDASLERDVALKFLPPLSTRLDDEERLLREARAAAALEHPNICTVHEIGQTEDGRPFIAMALYEGETLKDRLRQGPLPLEEAVATAVQIARGLAAAHARGIVHRDVKPGNVILASDGTVRLLDFGIAQAIDATLTESGTTPGTAAYMSPEQVRGDPVDPRTDLWSLGVVLYETLVGERPFREEDDTTLLEAILHADPEPVSRRRTEVPQPLTRIVERLLAKDPDARFASAIEVLAELTQALPSGAGPPRVVTRRRVAALAGATIAVMGFGAAGLWLAGRGEKSVSAVGAAPGAVERVLVADFANFTSDSLLGDAVSQALRIDIAHSPAVRLAGDAAVSAALRLMLREPGSRLDSDIVREVAVREGIRAVIDGEVRRTGAGYVVSASIVEASTGDVVDGWRETARDSTGLIDAIDRLSATIRGRLGESVASLQTGEPLRRSTTSSLEALRQHSQGWRAFLRGDYDLAATLFEEATRIDPTFAHAHVALAYSLLNAGLRRGRAVEAVVRAYGLRDRLSVPERHAIVATYYSHVVGELPQAIEAYRNQVEAAKASGDFFMYAGLIRHLALAGDLASAEAAGREAREVSPAALDQAALITVLYRRGKASEANTVLREAMERFPNHPVLRRIQADMAFASGDYAVADSLSRPLSSGYGFDAPDIRAQCAAIQGRVGDAIGHLRALRQQSLSTGHVARAAEVTVAIGRLQMTRGRPEAGLAEVEEFLAGQSMDSLDALDRPYLALVRLYAEAGEPVRARQFVAEYETVVPEQFQGPDRWQLLRAWAAIRLAEGKPLESLAYLQRAAREPPLRGSFSFEDPLLPLPFEAWPELARAHDRAGHADPAIATYERYLATPSLSNGRLKLNAFELPDVLFRLAELYEARQDRAAAARYYLRFAELWENADPELQPRVEAARRQAAALQNL